MRPARLPLDRAGLARLGAPFWRLVALGTLVALARFSEAFLVLRASERGVPLTWVPLVLVGILIVFFLMLEARRYRYFNVWRARCRVLEIDVCAPLLRGEGVRMDGKWNTLLADDYEGCLRIALDQENSGAHVLDLCTAYAGRDEKADLLRLVRMCAQSVRLPLVIDSTTPDCIEARA